MSDYLEPYPEMEFRDGKRVVPPHVRAILGDLPTFQMTFSEAMALANKKLTIDFINNKQQAVIRDHFRR